jgi:small subunit ribosomal protein S20
MANNPGAKKAIRKIERRTEVNKARRSRVRTFLRKFDEALAAGDAAAAKAAFIVAQSELMRRRVQGRGSQEHGLAQGLAPERPAEEALGGLISGRPGSGRRKPFA